jgi:hypothetical protein
MNSEIIALKEPTGGGLSSPIFFNLRRNGSIFGFWIFSEKYPAGAEILHGDVFLNGVDHACALGAGN